MGIDPVVHGNRRPRSEPLQFDLRYLFLLVALNAVNFALLRSAGCFVAVLAIGPLILTWLIHRFRIENMVCGMLFGGFVAAVIVIFAASLFGPVAPVEFVFALLLYPVLGCAFALTYVTHQQLRQGR